MLLRGGPTDSFGGVTVLVPGLVQTEIIVVLSDRTSLEPNGVYGIDPDATGVNIIAGQGVILDAVNAGHVPAMGFVDIQ